MRPRDGVPTIRVGAGICIMAPGDRMLIVQQEREGLTEWGLVGGSLEHGESIEECAVREAREESGLNIRLIRLVSVDQFWHGGVFTGVGFNFLAEPDPWPQDVRIPEFDGATRFLDYRWIGRSDAPTYYPESTWDLWVQHWPSEIQDTLLRKLEFDQ